MDKRHIYGLMIDTETANSMDVPLVYDIGYQIIDSKGRKYEERSFVVKDIFCDEREIMRTAYYAKKIPQYVEDIRNGSRLLLPLANIKRIIQADIENYNCKFICAHNARFDYKSIHTTQRWLTKSKWRYFFPKGLVWYDTMKMSNDVIVPMKMYQRFCEKNGYLTKAGKPRKTAEILYRYIINDNTYIEEHKGLQDVDIERQIFAYCVRQKKKMNKKLFNS